jgi:hypothetical protein
MVHADETPSLRPDLATLARDQRADDPSEGDQVKPQVSLRDYVGTARAVTDPGSSGRRHRVESSSDLKSIKKASGVVISGYGIELLIAEYSVVGNGKQTMHFGDCLQKENPAAHLDDRGIAGVPKGGGFPLISGKKKNGRPSGRPVLSKERRATSI